MDLTESAQKLILDIMKRQNLDPKTYSLHLSKSETDSNGIAIGFCVDEFGHNLNYGELKVILAYNLDVSNLKIGVQEINNKKYLTFKGE